MHRSVSFGLWQRAINLVLIISLALSPVTGHAQSAFVSALPEPGAMLGTSSVFVPALLRGMTIHPDNPFQFDFIVDNGNSALAGEALKSEAKRLVDYFLASMTVPQNDLWVNLSPVEKDRIIPDALGKTELGQDLLAQDYTLKQLASTLMYPEGALGKKFWDRIYQEAKEKYGVTDIPTDTFNKVWIMPESATIYENGARVYVVEAKLKVMLDQDRLAQSTAQPGALTADAAKVMREVIIPAIEAEVNTGKNFAPLRQIYYSLILAKWYKEKVRNSILNSKYIDRNKVQGIDLSDPAAKEQVYARYLEAYKKGVYNYIKEETNPATGETIPRKYFSGGFTDNAGMTLTRTSAVNEAQSVVGQNFTMSVNIRPESKSLDAAQGRKPKLLLFGGSAAPDYFHEAVSDRYEVQSIMTSFDGGLIPGRQGQVETASSTGVLRNRDDYLPALGDISKAIVNRADPALVYLRDILLMRFDANGVFDEKNKGTKKLYWTALRLPATFEQVIIRILDMYINSLDVKSNNNHPVKSSAYYREFQNKLIRIARDFDKKKPGFLATVWGHEYEAKFAGHSVKNIVLYALYKKSGNWETAINEFAELVGIRMSKGQIHSMLVTNDTNGFDLVAQLSDGFYLLGQEEITQHVTQLGQANLPGVEKIFFASREEMRKVAAGIPGNLELSKNAPAINGAVKAAIETLNKGNEGVTASEDLGPIVFGPGSQFSSVLVHLLIPGVFAALRDAKHTPRILLLNPMKDAEVLEIGDGTYFETVMTIIQNIIKMSFPGEELDISDFFDFVGVNNTQYVTQEVLAQEKEEKRNKDAPRHKKRLGVIRFGAVEQKNALEILKNRHHPIALVTGNLMEVAEIKGKMQNTLTVKRLNSILDAVKEYYMQSRKVGDAKRSGVIFAADPHASLDGALRLMLAFPKSPFVVVGDTSDRGHNLFPLFRIIDNHVTGDHEMWSIAGAIAGNESMTALFLRMAYNYENDDLMRFYGLEDILGLVLNEKGEFYQSLSPAFKEELGKAKIKSVSKSAGTIFNYLFSKLYYEYQINTKFKKSEIEKDKMYTELADLLLNVFNAKGGPLFSLSEEVINKLAEISESTINSSSEDLIVKSIFADLADRKKALGDSKKKWEKVKGPSEEEKAGFKLEQQGIKQQIEGLEKARKSEAMKGRVQELVDFIKASKSLKDGKNLSLLTPAERNLMNNVMARIKEEIAKGKGKNESFYSATAQFLKEPFFQVIKPEPQISRNEDTRKVAILHPGITDKSLIIHVLPAMNTQGEFVDSFGNPLPEKIGLRGYYEKLNEAVSSLREEFLKKGAEINPDFQLFAGYFVNGDGSVQERALPLQDWVVQIADSLNGPAFARKHERIAQKYLDPDKKEEDNIVYALFYKNNVSGFTGIDEGQKKKLMGIYGLEDQDFEIPKGSSMYCFVQSRASLIQEKIMGHILKQFGGDRLIVGHKKLKENQVVVKLDGKLIIADPEFAQKGGKTGALDSTQNGAAVFVDNNGNAHVIKLINMKQLFMDPKDFVLSIKGAKEEEADSNFQELTPSRVDIGTLTGIRDEVIQRLTLRDIEYYDIAISSQQLKGIEQKKTQRRRDLPTLYGELVEIVSFLAKKEVKSIDDIGKELIGLSVQYTGEINKTVVNALVEKLKAEMRSDGNISIFGNISEHPPQRFLLPVIIAFKDKDANGGSKESFEIRRLDHNGESLVIKDSHEFLDMLKVRSLEKALRPDFANPAPYGNIGDDIRDDIRDAAMLVDENGGLSLKGVSEIFGLNNFPGGKAPVLETTDDLLELIEVDMDENKVQVHPYLKDPARRQLFELLLEGALRSFLPTGYDNTPELKRVNVFAQTVSRFVSLKKDQRAHIVEQLDAAPLESAQRFAFFLKANAMGEKPRMNDIWRALKAYTHAAANDAGDIVADDGAGTKVSVQDLMMPQYGLYQMKNDPETVEHGVTSVIRISEPGLNQNLLALSTAMETVLRGIPGVILKQYASAQLHATIAPVVRGKFSEGSGDKQYTAVLKDAQSLDFEAALTTLVRTKEFNINFKPDQVMINGQGEILVWGEAESGLSQLRDEFINKAHFNKRDINSAVHVTLGTIANYHLLTRAQKTLLAETIKAKLIELKAVTGFLGSMLVERVSFVYYLDRGLNKVRNEVIVPLGGAGHLNVVELRKELLTDNAQNNDVGGIDLNRIETKTTGSGAAIEFSPEAMKPFMDMDVEGFSPVIINITPVASILPLLGLHSVPYSSVDG